MKRILLVPLAACTFAVPEAPDQGQVDASPGATPDANPDASPDGGGNNKVTLTQTADATFDTTHTTTCVNHTGFHTKENGWYRVFPLAEHNITAALHVDQVKFGVLESVGSPEIQVRIGTYAGPLGEVLPGSQITALGSATATVPPSSSPQWVSVPVSAEIPAGSNLVIEVYTPDLEGTGKEIFFGATLSDETRPGYQRAPFCHHNTPRATDTIYETLRLMITVDGRW